MGGAKKKSLVKTLKQQQLQAKKQESQQQKKGAKKKAPEKTFGGVVFPNISKKTIITELNGMKAITPYSVAMKYNVRQSVAKKLLHGLEKDGVISPVSGNSRLRIYKVVAS